MRDYILLRDTADRNSGCCAVLSRNELGCIVDYLATMYFFLFFFAFALLYFVYDLIINNSDVYHWCALAGALLFNECRGANNFLAIYTPMCDCDQVIHIRSAVIGFSEEWDAANNRRRCPPIGTHMSCTREVTNHSAIMNCQGKSRCWIPRDILSTPDKLCERHPNGNAISVVYDCINPGKMNWCICFRSKDLPFFA